MNSYQLFTTAMILSAATVFSGCTTTRTTDTARTGMEQLLISNAVDQTLNKVALPPVAGRKVFVDDKYLDAIDKGYILGSMRQRLLASGAHVVDAKEGSDLTMEIFSGAVGTDNVESFLGVPGLTVADDSHWSIAGIGPFQEGTVREEVNRSTTATDFTARVANGAQNLSFR